MSDARFEIITDPDAMPEGWREIVRKSGEIALRLVNDHGEAWAGLYSGSRLGRHLASCAGRAFERNAVAGESPEDYLCRVIVRAID